MTVSGSYACRLAGAALYAAALFFPPPAVCCPLRFCFSAAFCPLASPDEREDFIVPIRLILPSFIRAYFFRLPCVFLTPLDEELLEEERLDELLFPLAFSLRMITVGLPGAVACARSAAPCAGLMPAWAYSAALGE